MYFLVIRMIKMLFCVFFYENVEKFAGFLVKFFGNPAKKTGAGSLNLKP